jgi:hypothetical protein
LPYVPTGKMVQVSEFVLVENVEWEN